MTMADLEPSATPPRRRLLGLGARPARRSTRASTSGATWRSAGPTAATWPRRVEAIDNLAQSLAVALTTALGSDVFNTDFGFDGLNALVEETDPAAGPRAGPGLGRSSVLRRDAARPPDRRREARRRAAAAGAVGGDDRDRLGRSVVGSGLRDRRRRPGAVDLGRVVPSG